MTPRRYGPFAHVPINRRPPLAWPGGARVALWVNPNVEFFGLDDVIPGNLNDRVPRDQAKIPNVRNWAVRDYGNPSRIVSARSTRRSNTSARTMAFGAPRAGKSCSIFWHSKNSAPAKPMWSRRVEWQPGSMRAHLRGCGNK
jgi:hypothetical protein